MAKCKFCGADVEVGAKCSYCGSIAERLYYPDYKEDKKPEKKDTGIKSRLTIPVNSYYNVKNGDNLWNISKRAYGRGDLYYHIVRANRGIITDENRIYPKQRFFIPDIGERRY